MFSNDAAPTRANIKKRLAAAGEALNSAAALLDNGDHQDGELRQAVVNAAAWNERAVRVLATLKGKRR